MYNRTIAPVRRASVASEYHTLIRHAFTIEFGIDPHNRFTYVGPSHQLIAKGELPPLPASIHQLRRSIQRHSGRFAQTVDEPVLKYSLEVKAFLFGQFSPTTQQHNRR